LLTVAHEKASLASARILLRSLLVTIIIIVVRWVTVIDAAAWHVVSAIESAHDLPLFKIALAWVFTVKVHL